MGKSIRCKVNKRLRAAKRGRVDSMITTPREYEHNVSLRRTIEGRQFVLSKPKNAFLFPDAPDAFFPQHEQMKPLDFRPEALPMAAFAFRGNRRKYNGEEAERMAALSKVHPKPEVLVGGGAVSAKTGLKVSKEEAQLIATQHQNPAAAASAMAPPSAAEAVAAAANAERADAAAGLKLEPREKVKDAEPVNAVDTARPPVLKDERRVKRTTDGRARPPTVKKGKNPAAPPARAEKVKNKASKKGASNGKSAVKMVA